MNVSLEDLIDELDPEERNRVEILTQALIAEELAFRKLCDARERVLDAITQGHPVTPEHVADLTMRFGTISTKSAVVPPTRTSGARSGNPTSKTRPRPRLPRSSRLSFVPPPAPMPGGRKTPPSHPPVPIYFLQRRHRPPVRSGEKPLHGLPIRHLPPVPPAAFFKSQLLRLEPPDPRPRFQVAIIAT